MAIRNPEDKSKIYYVPSFISGSYHAGSKARKDCEEIFKSLSCIPFEIQREVGSFKIWLVKNIMRNILSKFFSKLFKRVEKTQGRTTNSQEYTSSSIIYQNLDPSADLIASLTIKEKFGSGKRIVLIHDISSLRFGGIKNYLLERFMIRNFTHVIVHSKEMERYIVNRLKFKGKTYVLGFFDYLIPHVNKTHYGFPKDGKFILVFAGNLDRDKSGFIYRLSDLKEEPMNYSLKLFGINYEPIENQNSVQYMGAFSPEELPHQIKGHFGLIWDGESVDSIEGNYGKYLRYNSPHKASLYIICGLPIITWKRAAIYDFVKQYNIGFGIDSISELDVKLQSISEEEYINWKRNVDKLADKLSTGSNLSNILKEIMND